MRIALGRIAILCAVFLIFLVFKDHASLVLQHDPDHDRGLRVWRAGETDVGEDRPTGCARVWQYTYCNDLPRSRKNTD